MNKIVRRLVPILSVWSTSLLLAQEPIKRPDPCQGPGPCLKVSSQGWIVGEVRAFAVDDRSIELRRELGANGWAECRGQAADSKTFASLYEATRGAWGLPDAHDDFFLPDLRGSFIRGWNDGRTANDPKYDVNETPLRGDPDVAKRSAPRPEINENVGYPGPTGDHVGTAQSGQPGPHNHPYDVHVRAVQNAYDHGAPRTGVFGDGEGFGSQYTGVNATAETRMPNFALALFIYTGAPVEDVPSGDKSLASDRVGMSHGRIRRLHRHTHTKGGGRSRSE